MCRAKSRPLLLAIATALLASFAGSRHARAESQDEYVAPATRARDDRGGGDSQDPDANEHFRIGALAGVGFPHALSFEGLVKVERVVALGVEYSLLPRVNISGVETNFWALAGVARIFPFRGPFFIGARAGFQRVRASSDVVIGPLSLVDSALAETTFINPRLGFLFTSHEGLTLGIDAGVQFPLRSSLVTTTPAAYAPHVDPTIAAITDWLGNGVTPTVDILKLGLLF